jgi:transposase-like protein
MEEHRTRQGAASNVTWGALEGFTRQKIQGWVQALLEEEVTELLGRSRSERRGDVDAPSGYRNGYGKRRRLSMQAGTVELRRPRVRGLEERFESRVLPLFERRTKEVGRLLPELYLHGLSQGDFELALRGLLGEGAPLSPSSIERLRSKWQQEYDEWSGRPLHDLRLVYLWADGVYVKAGLEKEKAALLVVIGATVDGQKHVLSVVPGHRESKESWAFVFRDLKKRGLKAPKLMIADGNSGVWGALSEVWPEVGEQRCWNHKIVNVLDQLPKKLQAEGRELLTRIPYAPTREEAEKAKADFARRFRKSQQKAVTILEADWERMLTFYEFPEQHWKHLRTTNVIESPFAAVRLRTGASKRFKKVASATALIWKVLLVAEKRFRRLNAPKLLLDVYENNQFVNGRPVTHGKSSTNMEAAA